MNNHGPDHASEPAGALQIAALQRRIDELDAFAYMVAHELRAPLLAIGGFARTVELTDAENLSPKAMSRLQRLIAAVAKMERLIDDLLALARAGHVELRLEPVAMRELVREVLQEMRTAYPATQVITNGLPMVRADPALARQVLVNLIDNALKYSALATAPRVEIGVTEEGAMYVRDNGIGFDMEKAGALFKPFERVTGDPAYPGTGAGLAIVHRLLERHGGWITAQSREGGPTEFRFSFGAY